MYPQSVRRYFRCFNVHKIEFVGNLVDDLFVHSLTSHIALLLFVLIRLEGVTPGISD